LHENRIHSAVKAQVFGQESLLSSGELVSFLRELPHLLFPGDAALARMSHHVFDLCLESYGLSLEFRVFFLEFHQPLLHCLFLSYLALDELLGYLGEALVVALSEFIFL
jgi:hypothetical protein